MAVVDAIFGGNDNAPMDAANAQIAQQQKSLDFMKDMYAPIMGMQSAVSPMITDMLTGKYDMTSDPYYQQNLDMMNSNILGNSAVTGGTRGGDIKGSLGTAPTQLAQSMYQQKLGNLMKPFGLDSGANQMANQMNMMGQTQAQGIIGQAQSSQDRTNNLLNMGMNAAGMAMMFSDIRLKDSIVKIGNTSIEGVGRYGWKWNDSAKALGLSGSDKGYLAQEVEKVFPELVHETETGYKAIDIQGLEDKLND